MLDSETKNILAKINDVSFFLESKFPNSKNLINLIINTFISCESLIIFAPPGFGCWYYLEEIARNFSLKIFSYAIFNDTSPIEFSMKDELKIKNSFDSADIVCLDEFFRSNSKVLNFLFSILNERANCKYSESIKIKPRSIIAKSNLESANLEEYKAILDRFATCYFAPSGLLIEDYKNGLSFGLKDLKTPDMHNTGIISANELNTIYFKMTSVSLDYVTPSFNLFFENVVKLGVNISIRRKMQFMKLISIATLRRFSVCSKNEDLWCLQYIGDSFGKQNIFSNILNNIAKGKTNDLRRELDNEYMREVIIKKKLKIFLSHSNSDKMFAEKIANDLRNSGINVWFDKWEIRVGESIVKRIQEGIEDTDFLIVILSPKAVESKWVERELNSALIKELKDKSIVILPILYQNCKIPAMITDKKYADFRFNYREGLSQLIGAIKPSI